MENCTKFNDLEAHLRELFKSASYSESTVKDMDFILRAFTNYMNANGMEEYSPEIGEILIHYCRETLKVCDSRVSRAKVIVGKLNRLYQGLDGEEALWADKIVPVELPDSLSRALDSFISHCRHKGNKETTLHYKRWICSRFLKNLEMLGCQSLQSINGELIQSAFLQLGYLRYWERIGPYIDLRISTFSVSSVYNDKRTLVLLDQYLVQTGFQGKNLTEDILSDWSKTLSGKSKTVKEKLGVVRGFGKYLNTLGYASFLPTLPKVKSDYIPYIFSDEEVTLIFHYADNMKPINPKSCSAYFQLKIPSSVLLFEENS